MQQNQARCRATRNRRHNPTVAQYLGLGSSDESAHLENYAPLSASHSPSAASRKRNIQGSDDQVSDRPQRSPYGGFEFESSQQLVSESFRVKKAIHRLPTNKQPYSAGSPAATSSQTASSQAVSLTGTPLGEYQQAAPTRDFREETIIASKPQDLIHSDNFSDHGVMTKEDVDVWQHANVHMVPDDDEFDCGILDHDLLNLMPDTSSDTASRPSKLTGIDESGFKKEAKCSLPDMTPNTPDRHASLNISQRLWSKFKPPLTQTSQLLTATGDVENPDARKPIVRPAFPTAVRDRSPIIGLSSHTLLRTCFRIGEVINQSVRASRSGKAVIFELYARVLESERTEMQQMLTFCDLFHAKPPYIKGTYHATIWKSVQLFEYDGRRLLQKGRICRCIGTMKRADKEWIMTIVNIWEATWEDVKWVEGIVGF